MRQAVQAFFISGVLLSAAACGTATNPSPGEPGAGIGSASAPPAAHGSAASVKSSCEAIGQVYGKHMAPFAQALTKLADARKSGGDEKKSQQEVEQKLTAFATAIRGATEPSTNAELRTAGQQTAEQLQAKAADAKSFSAVKGTEDVNTALGSTLKGWLAPLDKHCS